MRPLYVRIMDVLYYACMAVAGIAIVVMAVIIGWSVYTRYVLTEGSFWAEPISIALAVQMTFYGAAACYRANAHISIDLLVRGLRGPASVMATRLVDILMLLISLAMIWYGIGLVQTTFFQVYPEFQHIRVGVVYSALPGSGLVTLLFVIERLVYGPPALETDTDDATGVDGRPGVPV
ncbi:MAG: TRAP transporter small permease [Rhizobiales bacterium]|nr:TRAP transporter small permease [Hyphomicrobiales bacterium]